MTTPTTSPASTAETLPAQLRRYADAIENELTIGRPRRVGDASDCSSPVMREAATIIDQLRAELASKSTALLGLRARIDRAVKAAEDVFGDSAIRYKLSLFKNGRAMNYFPAHMDGGWFAFQRAEDDAHIGLCDQIVGLRAELAALKAVAPAAGLVVGWQPIDTAPKGDGYALLATSAWVCEGWWDDTTSAWWELNNHGTDTWGSQLYPTHWMPLPSAPQAAQKEGE
jgi:hypothetical protein